MPVACGSAPEGASGGDRGGATATRGGRGSGGGSVVSTARSFSPETRAFMEAGLRQFSRGDPGWDQTRAKWLAMGDRESRFLVTVLWAALLRVQSPEMAEHLAKADKAAARSGSRITGGHLAERARHELAIIGGPAIPTMTAVLAGGKLFTVYDEIEDVDRDVAIDDTSRREAAAILTIIGPGAVPALNDVLRRAETKSGRRFALMALGDMGDRGGADAASTLASWAQSDDWILRVDAVHGMRLMSDGTTGSALIGALSDDESLVREKAADSLAVRGETGAVGALRRAAQSARDRGALGEAARYARAIRAIEGRRR